MWTRPDVTLVQNGSESEVCIQEATQTDDLFTADVWFRFTVSAAADGCLWQVPSCCFLLARSWLSGSVWSCCCVNMWFLCTFLCRLQWTLVFAAQTYNQGHTKVWICLCLWAGLCFVFVDILSLCGHLPGPHNGKPPFVILFHTYSNINTNHGGSSPDCSFLWIQLVSAAVEWEECERESGRTAWSYLFTNCVCVCVCVILLPVSWTLPPASPTVSVVSNLQLIRGESINRFCKDHQHVIQWVLQSWRTH